MKRNESRAEEFKVGEGLTPLFGPPQKPNGQVEQSNQLDDEYGHRKEKAMIISMKERLKTATEQLKNKRLNEIVYRPNQPLKTAETSENIISTGKFTFRNSTDENINIKAKIEENKTKDSRYGGMAKPVGRTDTEQEKENQRNGFKERKGLRTEANGGRNGTDNRWLKRRVIEDAAKNSQKSNKSQVSPSEGVSPHRPSDVSYRSKALPTASDFVVQPFDSHSRTISAELSSDKQGKGPIQTVQSVAYTPLSNLRSYDNLSSITLRPQKRLEINKANCKSVSNDLSAEDSHKAAYPGPNIRHKWMPQKCREASIIPDKAKRRPVDGTKHVKNSSNSNNLLREDFNNKASKEDLVRSGKEMFKEWGKQLQLFQQKQLKYLSGQLAPFPSDPESNLPQPLPKQPENQPNEQTTSAKPRQQIKSPYGTNQGKKPSPNRNISQTKRVSEKGSASMTNIFQQTPRNAIQVTDAVTATPTFYFEKRDCRSHSPSQYQSPGTNKRLVSFPADAIQFQNGVTEDSYFSNLMREFKLNSAHLKEFSSAPLSPQGKGGSKWLSPKSTTKNKNMKLIERLASGVPEKISPKAMRELSKKNYSKLADIVEREKSLKKLDEVRDRMKRRQEYDKVTAG